MAIRKNSKMVKEILANDNLKIEVITDWSHDSTMNALRNDFNQFSWMVSVQEYSKGKVMFHFHSNLAYIVTLA